MEDRTTYTESREGLVGSDDADQLTHNLDLLRKEFQMIAEDLRVEIARVREKIERMEGEL